MINLYYIENISRLDTLYFRNIQQQNTFFDSKLKTSLDVKFPPHFKNSIRFEISDLDLSTQVNYLSLYFNGKYYYYFIDGINYTNEGIYDIEITMDTIQTYMFNISFKSALVNRMSIPRWIKDDNGYKINRDYIRENLSNGNFFTTIYEELSQKYLEFYCITSREKLGVPAESIMYQETAVLNYVIDDNTTYNLNNGLYYYLIPVFNIKDSRDFYYKIKLPNNEYAIYNTNYRNIMEYISQDPKVINIRYIKIPNSYLSIFDYNIYYDSSIQSNVVEFDLFDVNNINYLSMVSYIQSETVIAKIISVTALTIQDKSILRHINIESGFKQSTNTGNSFDIRFIPQLIDENYININFGERLGFTGFPLHLLDTDYVYLSEFYDIIDGNRIFKITDNSNKDKHLTTIINSTDEVIDIYNDQWQNYMSTNKGTLTTGIKLAKQNNLYNLGMSSFKNISSTISDIVFMPAPISPKSSNVGSKINRGVSGLINQVGIVGDYLMENYNIDKRLQITRENYEYAPDTQKQGNTISADIKAKSLEVIYRVNVVEDYLQVAKKLEYYGYKVSKYYNNKSLFDELNIRFYYNIIQCEDITFDLNDVINTQDIIQNIKNRFINGLRLWNSDINYVRFDLDNVEKEVI